MIPSLNSRKRRLVPKWRTFDRTSMAHELDSITKSPEKVFESNDEYEKKLRVWNTTKNLVSGAELIQAAIITDRQRDVVGVAEQFLSSFPHATSGLREMAKLVLQKHYEPEATIKNLNATDWRKRIKDTPDDAISWVELAFHQTLKGHTTHAERNMRVALQLAPQNRHVLRSASRLYLHLGDREQAYDIIQRSSRTKFDPWLMAAEMSLAGLADKQTKLFKHGLYFIESNQFHARHISELAGAMATLELNNGNNKKSKKLFQTSLESPTGNALAQAEWASESFSGGIVPEGKFQSTYEVFEARALQLYREDKFEEVVKACKGWAKEELISVQPFEVAANLAGMINHFGDACEIARMGLERRPNRPQLLNSYAFALTNLNRLDEAEQQIAFMPENIFDRSWFVSRANLGFIKLKRGDLVAAKNLYKEATDGFARLGDAHLVVSANYYLAKEAVALKIPGFGELLDKSVSELFEKFPKSTLARFLKQKSNTSGALGKLINMKFKF